MNLSVLHRRLMQDVLEIGNSLPLVITGGYAVQAHELVDRPSRDIDVATDSDMPMEDIAAAAAAGLTARGWDGAHHRRRPALSSHDGHRSGYTRALRAGHPEGSLQPVPGSYAIRSGPGPL
jgi:hypothetical protein